MESGFAETFGDFGFAMRCKAVGLRDTGPCLSPFNAFMLLDRRGTRCPAHGAPCRERPGGRRVPGGSFRWSSGCPIRGCRAAPITTCQALHAQRGRRGVHLRGQGRLEMGLRVVESCELFSHVANIGDTPLVIIHPASTTHRQLDEEQAKKAGAGPEVIRLSIGLETAADIIADLKQALRAAARATTASAAWERGFRGARLFGLLPKGRKVLSVSTPGAPTYDVEHPESRSAPATQSWPRLTGESMTKAVTDAIRERLERERKRNEDKLFAELMDILRGAVRAAIRVPTTLKS